MRRWSSESPRGGFSRIPWAAGAAIIAAALGAGLNTAVFAVAYGVLLRPLPYAARRPARPGGDRHVVSAGRGVEEPPARRSSGSTGYARDRLTVRGAGEPRLSGVAVVDGEFFDTLGGAARGRPSVRPRRGDGRGGRQRSLRAPVR